MDAPLYPPAKAFVQPTRVARVMTTKDTSIADIKANPAAWAIVLKEIPGIEARIGNDMLKPHLGNFSFRSLVQFGIVKGDVLDLIDTQFRMLGAVQ
jgi:hypothetical protein